VRLRKVILLKQEMSSYVPKVCLLLGLRIGSAVAFLLWVRHVGICLSDSSSLSDSASSSSHGIPSFFPFDIISEKIAESIRRQIQQRFLSFLLVVSVVMFGLSGVSCIYLRYVNSPLHNVPEEAKTKAIFHVFLYSLFSTVLFLAIPLSATPSMLHCLPYMLLTVLFIKDRYHTLHVAAFAMLVAATVVGHAGGRFASFPQGPWELVPCIFLTAQLLMLQSFSDNVAWDAMAPMLLLLIRSVLQLLVVVIMVLVLMSHEGSVEWTAGDALSGVLFFLNEFGVTVVARHGSSQLNAACAIVATALPLTAAGLVATLGGLALSLSGCGAALLGYIVHYDTSIEQRMSQFRLLPSI